MSSSTEQIRINWDAIEDWWSVEHGGIASATSGAHAIGRTGILQVDATSGITGTEPGTGALALNTTLGEMQIYRWDSTNSSAGYEGLTDQKFSRIRKGMGAQAIPASTWTKAVCASTTFSGSYDGLSEWSAYRFTVDGPGYYFITAHILWPVTISEYNKGIAIYKNGAVLTRKKQYGSSILTLSVADIVSLVTNDYIEFYAWHNHTASVSIEAATIQITRVS